MKLILKILGSIILVAVVTYSLGPKQEYDTVDNTPYKLQLPLNEIDDYVANKEARVTNIKPDNQARILWADSLTKTDYALVYIHGFQASWAEGHPITENFAKRYGCNAYLARISTQGLDNIDAMVNETPKKMIADAKEAIAIGKLLGSKVIVMSTSTGSTYSSYLAASDPEIAALIMTAPNFALADSRSAIVTKPWGKQIMKKMVGSNYYTWNASEEAKVYWNDKYRIEGIIALTELINQTMTPEIWQSIKAPVFVGYYFKDETHKDEVISIPAIHEFTEAISTPESKVRVVPFSSAKGHVIGSSIMNPNWEEVQDSMFIYAEQVLKLVPTVHKQAKVFGQY